MNFKDYEAGLQAHHDGKSRLAYPSRYSKKDWQKGWDEAHRTKVQSDEAEQENEFWRNISCNCPWLNDESDICLATRCECSKVKCAIFYFIKYQ